MLRCILVASTIVVRPSPQRAPLLSRPGVAGQSIVNHSNGGLYLGLATRQIAAIVREVDSTDANGASCTGVFVAPSWVVTAAHCLRIKSLAVVVEREATEAVEVLSVMRSLAHPTEDVALLLVDVSDGGLVTTVAPLRAGGSAVAQIASGDAVEIGGYGRTEARMKPQRRFLVHRRRDALQHSAV